VRSLPVFVLSRLLSVLAVVLAVTVITFLTFHLLRPEYFAFDQRPLLEQLLDHLRRAFLHLDFGISDDKQRRPVAEMMGKGLPADVALLSGAIVLGTVSGMAGGAVCARRPGSLPARTLEAAAAFFIIAPVYWVGLMIILTFGAGFGAIPIPFFETNIYVPLSEDPVTWARSLAVPWVVLSLPLAAFCLRMTRAALVDIEHEDYLRTAVAKGLRERDVVRRHALPAASSPVFTMVGVNMATLVTNVVLVEHAFSVPGVFRYTTQAMNDANFPLLQGMTIAAAVLVVGANLAVDVVQAAIDPRVRMHAS
jgi:peptide/nickel transport system permease protein